MNDIDAREIPIFINVRDRLTCLRQLLVWLEEARYRNIVLIDNASSYPPLLEYLAGCPHRVFRLRKNLGHTALWQIPEFRKIVATQWYVYSDPDVVPTPSCPLDLVAQLRQLLQRFPGYLKAGPGLHLDDIPDSYHLKQRAIDLERALYGREVAPGVFQADIDTTFALHRPHTPYILGPALRLRGKYEIRHLPWYVNSESPDEEETYYRNHAARHVTNWNTASENVKLRRSISGGIASEMESDPVSLLRNLKRSNSGRMFSIISFFKFLDSTPGKKPLSVDRNEAAQQEIVDILLSDEWMMAANMIRRVDRIRRCLS